MTDDIRHDTRSWRLNKYHHDATPRIMTADEARRILDETPESVLVLDTETTGLNPLADDVLQVQAVKGSIVYINLHFDSHKAKWPEAQRVHKIAPSDVEGLEKLDEYPQILGKISQLLKGARLVVGYNVWFDLDMLIAAGVEVPKSIATCDVMLEFQPVYGEIQPYFGTYKWQKLTKAAEFYGIDTTGAHDALDDCIMTMKVLRAMTISTAQRQEKERDENEDHNDR